MRDRTAWLKALHIFVTGITILLVCGPSTASPFQLLVAGNDSPGLPLYTAVYPASAEGWEGEPALLLRTQLPESTTAEIGLNIPPGDYAIRAFVDQDGNEALNLSGRGRPTEPYASSLSPDRKRRSQRFEHAIVRLSAEQPSVTIELNYPRESRD
ncbi:DUF2141 domain-containing protein [Pseudomonas sp. gcc21]|uniref:DUF2141 domain-containing protein n=1 Tax=Pseudomonas sp. gcc21 TaxID=2726989 RepID=UPI001452A2A6|nr:DUF2141 domain-containing protein [Pseudomonas sp. gcc21]QJD60360.1 DUF2141 domain-containing protein [Pseudomonas sp. gcc21]